MINQIEKVFGDIKVVQRSDYKWGIVDSNDIEIVPFGKYGWIDSFEKGLCRVRSHGKLPYSKNIVATFDGKGPMCTDKQTIDKRIKDDFKKHPDDYAKWGIINRKGEEVLPVTNDEVWNFVGKNKFSTKVINNGSETEVYFHDLDPSFPVRGIHHSTSNNASYNNHYEEYAGTYAQDIAGYSDEDINDAFDGEPDAYWNID